ncbi:MAG: dual specificity protein phosphatase family protein [Candidatus Methanoperedens sp.]|nr:dual specificity protein phosphatase family protein [Candidatus Methanoperedens sp.]
MSNNKKIQCSKCGKWLIPEESVHSLHNSGECHVTCLDCAPAGRTISPDEIKGGRETLENISKLFANLNMTQHEGRCNFGPASSNEKIVYGAERPGYDSKRVALTKVREWIAFMKKQDIKRICCLLPENQLNYYDGIDLLTLYREKFEEDNICWTDIKDWHLCDKDKLLKKILPFLQESDRKKEKVVVHCSGGSGRTGHVLAAWLVHRHGLLPYEALLTVKKMEGVNRNPCEAVGKNATREDLYALLEASKCSEKDD